ncbi:MAG: ribonuclease HII [Eggerthellales bacterium]|nr:ribonuclease HII [Eggerthellales bacterium]
MARAIRGVGESATNHAQTVEEIRAKLACANASTLPSLERSLASDTRKGVISALNAARKRIAKETAEQARLEGLYTFQKDFANQSGASVVVGLDEVGRGSVAGPLAVGAVVLPEEPRIALLNDSKQLSPEQREEIAKEIKEVALAWTVQYIEPSYIDAHGMTASLIAAFRKAVKAIEDQGFAVDLILLDGNPLHFDKRERNIVKGDAKCASIAAASVVAKVERDTLMVELSSQYPEYGWDQCKGYASASHIEAIKERGLTPLHRVSFCQSFMQETLF